MLFSTIGQHRVFLWMLAAGAMMGAWYACMAVVRRLLRAGLWLGLLADLAFGAGGAAIFCLMLCAANYGQVRLYTVIAAAMGFALFMLGVFSPGRRIIFVVIDRFHRIIVKIGRYRWFKVIFR